MVICSWTYKVQNNVIIVRRSCDLLFSHYQVIPWQTKALDLQQLPLVRLVGVASPTYDKLPPIPDYLKVS